MAGLSQVVTLDDVDALMELLIDPVISGPIYNLPKPITRDNVLQFIEQHLFEQERGEGLLMISMTETGTVTAYHDVQVWPQWAAAELAGAISRDRQNTGKGGADASIAFDWLFEEIGVELICETGALDNVRTARLLERIGFSYMGEIESTLPGGGMRPSRYWELTKSNWADHRGT